MDASFHKKVLLINEYYKYKPHHYYFKQIDILNYNEKVLINYGYYQMTRYNSRLSLLIIKFILLILEKPHDYFLDSFKQIFLNY